MKAQKKTRYVQDVLAGVARPIAKEQQEGLALGHVSMRVAVLRVVRLMVEACALLLKDRRHIGAAVQQTKSSPVEFLRGAATTTANTTATDVREPTASQARNHEWND